MKDFFGIEIKVGDYLISGGLGNSEAIYGMKVCRVVELHKNDTVSVVKPVINHELGKAILKKCKIGSGYKYAIINPPLHYIEFFENIHTKNLIEVYNWISYGLLKNPKSKCK